ncbi:MAG: DUF3794 domain-containing protein [Clostridia bacterium]|nr:DUF3794 domain-containing protein [Clostridia bacterium]
MKRFYKKECESVCEYTLPDYMGDVKKILSVSAKAQPSGKFASDGELECSGIVSYDILYSDSEGKLTHAALSSDYDITFSVDSERYLDSFVSATAASPTLRLNGPRKLTAKSVVTNNLTLMLEDAVTTAGSAFADGFSPEVDRRSLQVEGRIFSSRSEREYAEEAERLADVIADDVEIIATSGAVRILESEAVDGAVKVKGEMIITVIVRTREQPPFAIRKTVPFEQNVDFATLTPGMAVSSDALLSSVSAGVADDGAEGSVVTVNAICEITCMTAENREVTPIVDAYLKNRDTDGTYRDFSYTELLGMGSLDNSFEASVMRSEVGCEDIRDVIYAAFTLRDVEYKVVKGGLDISANATVCAVACEINDKNEPQYLPLKFSSPMQLGVNCGFPIPEGAEIELELIPIDARHTILEDKITFKCSLTLKWSVAKNHTVRVMSECNVVSASDSPQNKSTVTVYYPDSEESLFDIAKRFHTTCAKIAGDNSLSDATFSSRDSATSLGIKKLIIR